MVVCVARLHFYSHISSPGSDVWALYLDLFDLSHEGFPACRVALRLSQRDVLPEQAVLVCFELVELSPKKIVGAAVLAEQRLQDIL